MAVEIENMKTLKEIISGSKNKLVVIDFFTKSAACDRIWRKVDQLRQDEFKDSVSFYRINVKNNQDVLKEFKIDVEATYIFFKNGTEIHRFEGDLIQSLKKDIETYK